MGDVEIRLFQPGDEATVNETFNKVFGTSRPLAEWLWKFPPDTDGRAIMLAFSEGRLLAQYAALPAVMRVDGNEVRAAQIVDVFAVRGSRDRLARRTVWTRTAERFFEEVAEGGRHPLLYGFPGRRALRLGVLQLGYDAMVPEAIVYLRRRAAAGRVSSRRLPYRAEPARDWEPRLDELWAAARRDYPVAVVRDAGRALHRLAGHPSARYHKFLVFPRLSTSPVAFAAFRVADGVCRWVDLLWDHDHPGALALASRLGAGLGGRFGANGEELWLNGDEPGRELLVELGFEQVPEPNRLVMVARSFLPELDVRALEGRIYLTMADADLV